MHIVHIKLKINFRASEMTEGLNSGLKRLHESNGIWSKTWKMLGLEEHWRRLEDDMTGTKKWDGEERWGQVDAE